mmetsp:Transcript_38464/g.107160  ORF Transcript_38464/g.107160 Transcript_38464/m.107160 type:complete len:276 (-) Transcript_38464:249-1076(-)
MVTAAPADGQFPADLLGLHVYPQLSGAVLRHAALSCQRWLQGLRVAPKIVHERVRWRWRWRDASRSASICSDDPAVVTGGGGWHPGSVVLADLKLTASSEVAWRLVLGVSCSRGDLLMGITQSLQAAALHVADQDAPSALEEERAAEQDALDALEEGYSYIMGRERAPPSLFYGGNSCRCCFAVGDGSGPRIDYAQRDGRLVEMTLSKLRRAGDWVEFHLRRGVLSSIDFAGKTFQWSSHVPVGTVWYPTVAWTGSNAVLHLAFPEHFAAEQALE